MLVYSDGAPYSTTTIPAGGAQVTGDISIIKNISLDNAERIKLEAGCCWETLLEGDDDIIVPGVGGRSPLPIPRSQILTIIKPRMEEIFKMVKEKLDKLTLSRPLGAGIVLTGGGAQMLGAAELAGNIFKLPVRVGAPLPLGGLVEEYRSPEYAAAVGLVLEGNDRELAAGAERGGEKAVREKGQGDVFRKLREWLQKEFF